MKKGYSLSDQIGITIAALVEKDQRNLVEWTKQVGCRETRAVSMADVGG